MKRASCTKKWAVVGALWALLTAGIFGCAAQKFSVRFETNGGELLAEQRFAAEEELSLPRPTRPQCNFGGWFLDNTLTEEFAASVMPARDVTLYAKWVPATGDDILTFRLGNSGKEYMVVSADKGAVQVVVPEQYLGYPVTRISSRAFLGCVNLTSVAIPSGISAVGAEAFADCTALAEVTLGEGLATIGYEVFKRCTALSEIVIPASVKEMGYAVFMDAGLTRISCAAAQLPAGWDTGWTVGASAAVTWGSISGF